MKYEITKEQLEAIKNILINTKCENMTFKQIYNIINELDKLPIIEEIIND
jgi:hypothetical protein